MRHFISYHKQEKMGYSMERADPFSIVTRKRVAHLPGAKVWCIGGVGQPRSYFLHSWFIADDVGPSQQDGFENYVKGSVGHVFEPMPKLNDLPWFTRFREAQSNFSLGLQPISQDFIRHFEALVTA